MSAFVCQDATINRAVSFLAMDRDGEYLRKTITAETGCDLATQAGKQALGLAMFKLNCDGVDSRYGENQAAEFRPLDYQFRLEISVNRIQAYKSLKCWLYQCSEGEIPETSLLFASMNKIALELADDIVRRLPAYDAAKWD